MEDIKKVVVTANWDPEAKVWVAESNDIPGLITEAENAEALLAKLQVLIPELLEENRCLQGHDEVLDLSIRYCREDNTKLHVAS